MAVLTLAKIAEICTKIAEMSEDCGNMSEDFGGDNDDKDDGNDDDNDEAEYSTYLILMIIWTANLNKVACKLAFCSQ